MIIVSALFVVAWFPLKSYVMILSTGFATSEQVIGYLFSLVLAYANISLNLFIYATKHGGVRSVLARMFVCHKLENAASVPVTANVIEKTT